MYLAMSKVYIIVMEGHLNLYSSRTRLLTVLSGYIYMYSDSESKLAHISIDNHKIKDGRLYHDPIYIKEYRANYT